MSGLPRMLEHLLEQLEAKMEAELEARDKEKEKLEQELEESRQREAAQAIEIDRLRRENVALLQKLEDADGQELVVQAQKAEIRRLNSEIRVLIKEKKTIEETASPNPTEVPIIHIINSLPGNTYRKYYLELIYHLARLSGCAWYEVPQLYGSSLPPRLCKGVVTTVNSKHVNVTAAVPNALIA